ncbi:MAG: ABC transporter permease [Cypionkella sp.]
MIGERGCGAGDHRHPHGPFDDRRRVEYFHRFLGVRRVDDGRDHFGAFVGLIDGLLVVRAAVLSLVVTLGTLFAVAGFTLGLSVLVAGTTSVALKAGPEAKWLLGRSIGGVFQVTILWWIAAALLWGFLLHFTGFGNWIFAMGGDKVSARNAGIPTDWMTILLFMCSGASATFVGVSQAILYNSAQVSARQSYIFNAIISDVVGGVLLTGGYGSVVGIILGTLTFAVVS